MTQEKTEQPTARRLRKAREEGEHPLSGALVQSASAFALLLVLPSLGVGLWHLTARLLRQAFELDRTSLDDVLVSALLLTAPALGVAAAAAAVAAALQTQGHLSPKRIAPRFDALDPIAGAKKLLEPARIFQLARSAIATGAVAYAVYWLLSRHAGAIVATALEPRAALWLLGSLGLRLLWIGAGIGLCLALVDVLITHRSWLRRHRMSPDEIKREQRESEGDPEIKAQRNAAYQEMLRSAALGGVKNATVVIVNPTHFATALRYDPAADEAPIVLAQGRDHEARALIDAARAYGVPVVRDEGVARALHEIQLGEEIPEALFHAVADILSELWRSSDGEGDLASEVT